MTSLLDLESDFLFSPPTWNSGKDVAEEYPGCGVGEGGGEEGGQGVACRLCEKLLMLVINLRIALFPVVRFARSPILFGSARLIAVWHGWCRFIW